MNTAQNRFSTLLATLLVMLSLPAFAQDEEIVLEEGAGMEVTLMNVVDWQLGPTVGDMGKQALVDVPEGYMFIGRDDTRTLMQLFGNLLTERESGLIAPVPAEGTSDMPWFAVFEFDEVGYVKDDDKDSLDADAMLETMKEGEQYSNAEREKLGYPTMHTTGWAMPPRYSDQTQNLEWAVEFRSMPADSLVVNHNTRILGRGGVMEITLVVDPEHLQATLPTFQQCMAGFSYKPGKRYAEYTQGDKIAKYGLTGLVLGGGLAVAAKTGLLQKLFKPLIIGVIAIGAWCKKLFGGKKAA